MELRVPADILPRENTKRFLLCKRSMRISVELLHDLSDLPLPGA